MTADNVIPLDDAIRAARSAPPDAPPPIDPDAPAPPNGPVPLGHDQGVYYYLSGASGQVVGLTSPQHTRDGLRGLASVAHYWERTRFHAKTTRWEEAADWLMRCCEAQGVFDGNRLRGRGAHWDAGRAVVHLGDQLVVDGDPCDVGDLRTKFIYQRAAPLTDPLPPPLTATEAAQIMHICRSLRWDRGVHAYLLAGWLALAPVCGALTWRPSIWLTGSSGSGKSTILEQIIRAILGHLALAVQSKTSEAGLRQALGLDARPVIFDEMEREDLESARRVQGVLDLVRQSASESGAAIIKGTQNQSAAKRYHVRSMFCFSSINVGIEQYADESRISVLSLTATPQNDPEAHAAAEEHYQALCALIAATITPDLGPRLLARSSGMLGVIRASAAMFSTAVAAHLGNRRVGDQLGTLLAGAWCLHRDHPPDYDKALTWIRQHDWHGSTVADVAQDEVRLLDFIKQQSVRVTADNRPAERLLGELMEAATRDPVPPDHAGGAYGLPQDYAADQLKRQGVRYDPALPGEPATKTDAIRAANGAIGPGFWISDSHYALKRMLEGQPWASQWGRALGRLPGAFRSEPAVISFGSHAKTKATWVPHSLMFGGDEA